MVLSLAVLGIVVAFIYLFIPHSQKDPVKPVEYKVALATARRAAPFRVLAPEGLSKGWRATSVDYAAQDQDAGGAEWHLGFINPQQQYAAIEQTNGPAAPFVQDKSLGAHRRGTAEVDGRTWESYRGKKYDALVLRQKGVTTVVTGTASPAQLATLAGALR